MKSEVIKTKRRLRRTKRVRKKLLETKNRARLSVHRSNTRFYAQIIDDNKGETIVSVSEKELSEEKGLTKTEKASKLGLLLAQKAKEKKIGNVAFDKGEYRYHGRVKRFAESAREGGLKF